MKSTTYLRMPSPPPSPPPLLPPYHQRASTFTQTPPSPHSLILGANPPLSYASLAKATRQSSSAPIRTASTSSYHPSSVLPAPTMMAAVRSPSSKPPASSSTVPFTTKPPPARPVRPAHPLPAPYPTPLSFTGTALRKAACSAPRPFIMPTQPPDATSSPCSSSTASAMPQAPSPPASPRASASCPTMSTVRFRHLSGC